MEHTPRASCITPRSLSNVFLTVTIAYMPFDLISKNSLHFPKKCYNHLNNRNTCFET